MLNAVGACSQDEFSHEICENTLNKNLFSHDPGA